MPLFVRHAAGTALFNQRGAVLRLVLIVSTQNEVCSQAVYRKLVPFEFAPK
jgi:hypothetical protein